MGVGIRGDELAYPDRAEDDWPAVVSLPGTTGAVRSGVESFDARRGGHRLAVDRPGGDLDGRDGHRQGGPDPVADGTEETLEADVAECTAPAGVCASSWVAT